MSDKPLAAFSLSVANASSTPSAEVHALEHRPTVSTKRPRDDEDEDGVHRAHVKVEDAQASGAGGVAPPAATVAAVDVTDQGGATSTDAATIAPPLTSDHHCGGQPAGHASVTDDAPPPPPIPRSEHQFVPKCAHRHPLQRAARAAGGGTAEDEPLECDSCGMIILPADPRWSCHPCDFDLCELCLLGRSGGAAYLSLLATEEGKVRAARNELLAMEERARLAENKLAAAEKAAEGKASSASERRAAEARVLAAEERASAAAAEVARLEKEVVERRQRSKANLEKMYAAQKERDDTRALISVKEAEAEARISEQSSRADESARQVTAVRQQLACAFGDADALSGLALEEIEQLETLCYTGLGEIRKRRMTLNEAEERERRKSLDCAICLENPRAVAFAPCGHIACCKVCAANPTLDQCPLCKRGVGSKVNVFLP